jgi:hypothetical protein
VRRCHSTQGGCTAAECQNTEIPDKIRNKHNFPVDVVNLAASLLHKWFDDDELGLCRVVDFGGKPDQDGIMQPVLHYAHLDGDGVVEDTSTVEEVAAWVADNITNL